VPDDWRPRREPTSLALAVTAALDLARLPVDQARALAGAARRPTALARQARDAVTGLVSLAGALRPAARSSLSGSLTVGRTFAFTRSTVDDVSTVRHALGGTFNDVVLAAVTAGFRTLLLSRGEEPTRRAVRSLVPVSVRPPGAESVRDNEVSLLIAELPVEIADPVERLAAVRDHLGRLKARHEADAGASVVEFAGHEPFPTVAPPVRIGFHLRQRVITTVTTNVPGPRQPLYALGRRVAEIIPYVPIASTVRTGVSIFSYCGQVTFGVTGDAAAAADVETLARGIDDGMADLLAAARPLTTHGAAGPRPE
jgi:diacylglycerol O-acyltransferase